MEPGAMTLTHAVFFFKRHEGYARSIQLSPKQIAKLLHLVGAAHFEEILGFLAEMPEA